MANTTTTTLAAGIPAIVGQAIARAIDIPVLLQTCAVKTLRQGDGKTVKFPVLPASAGDFADASEGSAFSTTAYTPTSGTATVVERGYALEISDFAMSSSTLTIDEIIAELMAASYETDEKAIAATFTGFTTNAPVIGTMTVAKLFEADALLASRVGNSADLNREKVCALSNVQYSNLRGDIMVNKGANFIGTSPLNSTANTGVINDLMGIKILGSGQISQSGTSDPVGLLYVSGKTIGAAVQSLPTVVFERKALLPNGSIQGWIISVASRFGVCELRDTYGVQIQKV